MLEPGSENTLHQVSTSVRLEQYVNLLAGNFQKKMQVAKMIPTSFSSLKANVLSNKLLIGVSM